MDFFLKINKRVYATIRTLRVAWKYGLNVKVHCPILTIFTFLKSLQKLFKISITQPNPAIFYQTGTSLTYLLEKPWKLPRQQTKWIVIISLFVAQKHFPIISMEMSLTLSLSSPLAKLRCKWLFAAKFFVCCWAIVHTSREKWGQKMNISH